jgi:hypothetical protein
LSVNAAMRFGHLGASLEDQCLRGVKRGKVRGAASSFGELYTGDRSRFLDCLPCLV